MHCTPVFTVRAEAGAVFSRSDPFPRIAATLHNLISYGLPATRARCVGQLLPFLNIHAPEQEPTFSTLPHSLRDTLLRSVKPKWPLEYNFTRARGRLE